MKKLITTFVATILLCITYIGVMAQENQETEIRKLEKMEGDAFLKKDTVTLYKLFSPDIVVNTPLNRVATLQDLKKLIRAGKIDVTSIEKIIEKISFINDMAVVMGHDIVQPQGAMENAGKKVTRRYTDIWLKDKTGWRLTVRQATIISIQ